MLRAPRPRSNATSDASMTNSFSCLSMICCCTAARQLVPDRVRPRTGLLMQHGRAGRRRGEHVLLEQEVELVHADEARRLEQIRRAHRASGRSADARSCTSPTSSSRRRNSPARSGRDRRRGSSPSSCWRRPCRRRRGRRTARARRRAARCRIAGSTARLVCDTSSLMPTVKPCFGVGLVQLVEDRLGHRRIEILRRQAVASADQPRHAPATCRRRRPARTSTGRRGRAARPAPRSPSSGRARRALSPIRGSAARNASAAHGR